MKQLHLDSMYRRRWQEYHLATGEIVDSRKFNWRQVEWEKVVKIVTHMVRTTHEVNCFGKPKFEFFLCFRWSGNDWEYKKLKRIHLWTVGWSDGYWAYLEDINFFTGPDGLNTVSKPYKKLVKNLASHVHPRVAKLVKRNRRSGRRW